jgi:hypothetical protein
VHAAAHIKPYYQARQLSAQQTEAAFSQKNMRVFWQHSNSETDQSVLTLPIKQREGRAEENGHHNVCETRKKLEAQSGGG